MPTSGRYPIRNAAKHNTLLRQEARCVMAMVTTTTQIQTAIGRVSAASDQNRPLANQPHVPSDRQTVRQTAHVTSIVNSVSVLRSAHRKSEFGSSATSNPANIAAQ